MLNKALRSLKSGQMILLHDSSNSKTEIDMVMSAKLVTPNHKELSIEKATECAKINNFVLFGAKNILTSKEIHT